MDAVRHQDAVGADTGTSRRSPIPP
jgi:hypothetical protein